ncbi:hypothetical protein EYZ11_004927 [Aspergillus tanneri]|uniref:Uncharacterized protein n=1 Tax=Aspergillus tanneri TaxID=1220188 RepID=A0A4S3JJP3_9EURO|nr:hypothetical protein EYZ11_004927 [Aspergillus tanneri]
MGLTYETEADWLNISTSNFNASKPLHLESPPGDFPICTDTKGEFAPFCLPQNGTDVIVDATYYVTWNADFYPLNATITIELRFSDSTAGDSAFTSEKTGNSYGYIPLHMREDWLQGKSQNELTLYIIELDLKSDRRANAQQGPTVTLRRKPVEHHKPSPQLPFNRLALYIGLPVSLAVVIAVVAGLFFGMQERRKIGLGNVMGSRGSGYGVGKSRDQRLRHNKKELRRVDEDISESALYNDLERTASYVFNRDDSKLKSWKF